MGKIREQLFLKLWPIASGNHSHFDDTEKVMQQSPHFSVKRRFTFGKRTVQIEDNEFFHDRSTSEFLRSQLEFPVLPIISLLAVSKLVRQRNFQHVRWSAWPKNARSDHCGQEPHISFSKVVRCAAMLDLPCA